MCKCANDNCNCDTITLPSIPGPQGPAGLQGLQGPQGIQGIQGIQGLPGADAGNVIDTEINFGGISSSGLRRYVPSILVQHASEFHKNENRLKVRAVFKTEEIESAGQLSVFLNNNDNLTNAVEIVKWSGFYPALKYFYLEFYIDKWSNTAINVIGRACFTDTSDVGVNLFNLAVPSEDYFIFTTNFPVAPVDINQNFRIILATTDTAGVEPVYFTAEYIVRK
jgi:hypothetical protein